MKIKLFFVLLIAVLNFAIVSPGRAQEPIKVALIFARTGTAVSHNIEYFQWINFVMDHINAQGGVLDRRISVIDLDNKSTPLGSKKAALRAVKENVAAVIGPSWSSHALAAAPILQDAGIPMISPIATNPNVTLIGDYIFRVCFTDPFQGKVMAEFARKDLNATSAVILTNVTHDYCMGLAEYFKKTFQNYQLAFRWEGKYRDNDTDFTQLLKKIKVLAPDVIFVPGYERDSGFIINQARKMGITSIFLGGDGWGQKMYQYSRNTNVGSYFSSHWHPETSFSAGKTLQKAYCDKFGKTMSVDIALGYDAAMILIDAIRRAGMVDRKKIRQALSETRNFQGATGVITFDKNGDPENKDAVILKFGKEKPVFVKSIRPGD